MSLFFIALLGLLTIFSIPAINTWDRLLSVYCMLAAAIFALVFFRERMLKGQVGFYLHVALTVIVIFVLFNSLADLIRGIWPGTIDEQLIRIDYALFGVHPTVWMERMINPVLTAVLQFAYISYYFIPVALGITLLAKGRNEAFEEALFGTVLCFYLSYIGYLLAPAVGPRFTLAHLQTTGLEAGPFITAIQEILDSLEHNKTDAFPSGHTAIALVTLYYARKMKEKNLFRILLPVVLALILSTVYLRYHYVIDVIAGIALAVVAILLAPKLDRIFSGRAGYPRNKCHHTA